MLTTTAHFSLLMSYSLLQFNAFSIVKLCLIWQFSRESTVLHNETHFLLKYYTIISIVASGLEPVIFTPNSVVQCTAFENLCMVSQY